MHALGSSGRSTPGSDLTGHCGPLCTGRHADSAWAPWVGERESRASHAAHRDRRAAGRARRPGSAGDGSPRDTPGRVVAAAPAVRRGQQGGTRACSAMASPSQAAASGVFARPHAPVPVQRAGALVISVAVRHRPRAAGRSKHDMAPGARILDLGGRCRGCRRAVARRPPAPAPSQRGGMSPLRPLGERPSSGPASAGAAARE
jgi:hypothetical protein